MSFRRGNKLGTTIYRDDEQQPCAWVPNDPELAQRIVDFLNGAGWTNAIGATPMTEARLRQIDLAVRTYSQLGRIAAEELLTEIRRLQAILIETERLLLEGDHPITPPMNLALRVLHCGVQA